MQRINCRKIVHRLTPSGYSDNGIKDMIDGIVSFHPDKLKTATIAEVKYKGIDKPQASVTIDGVTWNVEMTPQLRKIMKS